MICCQRPLKFSNSNTKMLEQNLKSLENLQLDNDQLVLDNWCRAKLQRSTHIPYIDLHTSNKIIIPDLKEHIEGIRNGIYYLNDMTYIMTTSISYSHHGAIQQSELLRSTFNSLSVIY